MNKSPVVKKEISIGSMQMNFHNAIDEIMAGRKVTKLELKSSSYYGVLDDGILRIHKPDGKLYDWILSDGDIAGKDYIVI